MVSGDDSEWFGLLRGDRQRSVLRSASIVPEEFRPGRKALIRDKANGDVTVVRALESARMLLGDGDSSRVTALEWAVVVDLADRTHGGETVLEALAVTRTRRVLHHVLRQPGIRRTELDVPNQRLGESIQRLKDLQAIEVVKDRHSMRLKPAPADERALYRILQIGEAIAALAHIRRSTATTGRVLERPRRLDLRAPVAVHEPVAVDDGRERVLIQILRSAVTEDLSTDFLGLPTAVEGLLAVAHA